MDAIVNVTSGILKGAGKQKFGAVTNFIGYYLIGLPVGVALMMPWGADMKVPGYWWGQVIGLTVQSVVYVGYLTFKINWEKTAAEVVKIAAAGSSSSSSSSSPSKSEEAKRCSDANDDVATLPSDKCSNEVDAASPQEPDVDVVRRPNHVIKIVFIAVSFVAFVASLINSSIRYRIDLKYVPNSPIINASSINGSEIFNATVFDTNQSYITDLSNVTSLL